MENQIPNKKILLTLLVGAFLVFVITGLVLMRVKKGEKTTAPFVQTKPSPTVSSTEGYLRLATVGGASRFSKNQPVTVQLLADSSGEEVVGFDVLISFNPGQLNFVKAASLLPDFKVYSYKRENYVTLTVIKSLGSKTSSIFSGTPVVSLTFQPKTAGTVSVSLVSTLGKEKTALVNPQTKRIYPRLSGITFELN